MGRMVPHALPIEEVNSVDDGDLVAVNKVDRLVDVPLAMAKAHFGAAVKAAIADAPMKAYGDKGLLSGVTSGEKVPDYLARICQDDNARRRLALALLRDDAGVRVRTVVEWEEKVG